MGTECNRRQQHISETHSRIGKHVPAYVCPYCGDAILPSPVSRWLDDAMDAAEAAGGTTVREYDSEKAAA